VSETMIPSIPKSLWMDRCVMTLGNLRPDLSIQEAQTVALNILWSDEIDRLPEEAATAWACDFARPE
jgi:hypothetical protein